MRALNMRAQNKELAFRQRYGRRRRIVAPREKSSVLVEVVFSSPARQVRGSRFVYAEGGA
jgi:hypothetical protein